MNLEKAQTCADFLSELSGAFTSLPTNKEKAIEAAMYLTLAQTYVVEFASHLAKGLEPYDAVEATAQGLMEIPKSASGAATVLGILAKKGKPDPY